MWKNLNYFFYFCRSKNEVLKVIEKVNNIVISIIGFYYKLNLYFLKILY